MSGPQSKACWVSWLACALMPTLATAADYPPPGLMRPNSSPATQFADSPDLSNEPAVAEAAPSFEGQIAPQQQWLDAPADPCQPACPCAPAPLVEGPPPDASPLRRFIWNHAPEGVVPYWGPRTPDYRKDFGFGRPLPPGNGWRSQPFSISGFAGATNGGPLIRNHVDELPSAYAGANFGWDYDHFWGIEKRLGFGALNLTNGLHQRLPQTGLSVTGEYRVMFYPLGDTRWRPFLTTGIGWSDFYFYDDFHHRHINTLLSFPFGVGLKYHWSDHWALRIDLMDELTLSSAQTSTFNYVALTAGLEFRYGKRLLNMPWHRK
ncbi:MAG TPA: outer membrane beta-barrel protein [Pirellulales bacterium]|nr:outer membrane beta-barrel protein [Pirellulales bacterium]